MKKFAWPLFAVLLLLLVACGGSNVYRTDSGRFVYEVANRSVTITDYRSSGQAYEEIFIPETINDLPVETIARGAFTSSVSRGTLVAGVVVIPESVTTVKENAFTGTPGPNAIVLRAQEEPAGFQSGWNNTVAPVVYDYASMDVEGHYRYVVTNSDTVVLLKLLETFEDATFNVPQTIEGKPVVEISDMAAIGNTHIETLIVGEGIVRIGREAFSGLSALKTITLPESLVSMGERVFSGNRNLEEVNFHADSNLEALPPGAFRSSSPLPQFSNKITNIAIPDSVESIGSNAFLNGSTLETVTFGAESALKHIGEFAFRSTLSLESIEFPSTLETIGRQAFRNSGIVEFVFPEGLTRIEHGVFMESRALEKVVIGPHIESIAEAAFRDCVNLKVVVVQREASEGITTLDHWSSSLGRPFRQNHADFAIYVPENSFTEYSEDDRWDFYIDKLHTHEDLPAE